MSYTDPLILQLKNLPNQWLAWIKPHFASHLMYAKSPMKNRMASSILKMWTRSSASNLRVLAVASVSFKLLYCIVWCILGGSFSSVQWLTMLRFRPLNRGNLGPLPGSSILEVAKDLSHSDFGDVEAQSGWLSAKAWKFEDGKRYAKNPASFHRVPAKLPNVLHESNETFDMEWKKLHGIHMNTWILRGAMVILC